MPEKIYFLGTHLNWFTDWFGNELYWLLLKIKFNSILKYCTIAVGCLKRILTAKCNLPIFMIWSGKHFNIRTAVYIYIYIYILFLIILYIEKIKWIHGIMSFLLSTSLVVVCDIRLMKMMIMILQKLKGWLLVQNVILPCLVFQTLCAFVL